MYTITFTDSAGNPGTLKHAGPLPEACADFHGRVGPRWPVALDGKRGHFTAMPAGVVRFVALLAAIASLTGCAPETGPTTQGSRATCLAECKDLAEGGGKRLCEADCSIGEGAAELAPEPEPEPWRSSK
jgi:hypothetical protein